MARILVCDDSKLLRKEISDILKKDNHEVVDEASNGDEAYKKFVKLKPDIVTMDMLMEPDGHTAVKKIIKNFPSAKIIIITSLLDGKGQVAETVRLGGKGFVPKPVEEEVLLKEVRRVLSED